LPVKRSRLSRDYDGAVVIPAGSDIARSSAPPRGAEEVEAL
jgi:hypothetical protein